MALVSLLLAIGAVWQEADEGLPAYKPQQFFRGFARDVRNAAHIHIASKTGAFDVVFVPEKGWVVPQRGDYPASFDLVQRTLVGFAALQTIEPKTARPELFDLVGLDPPPRGNGVAITVSDDKGRELAALVAGKSEDIGDPSGATGLFVRRPNENQAWLVRAVFEPRPAISDWLSKQVLNLDRARIQEVDFDPAGGTTPFVVTRARPSEPDFKVLPVPAGKPAPDAGVADSVASALTEFGFDDVRPAHELDFANTALTARAVTKTFDGLKVTVNVQKAGPDYWATVSAEAFGPGDSAREAIQINAHASGWAYKLPAFKGQLFMTTLDSLLKAPAPGAGLPPGMAPQ